METSKGILYLLPTPLGEVSLNNCLPAFNLEVLNKINIYIVEEIRTARRFLKKAGILKQIDELIFRELNEHTELTTITHYLDETRQGMNIGLLSEAGVPCIADPGSKVVELAHTMGIIVKPLVGPSSILLALMSSGFNGQQFVFHGYLPVKPDQRAKSIKAIERDVLTTGKTQIFIETPYRNNAILQALISNCHLNTRLCVAADINLETEFIYTTTIHNWKKNTVHLNKRPTVFLIG